MKKLLSRFWKEEEGMGTVEIVIIIAVLVGVALIFRDAIGKFVGSMMDSLFGTDGSKGKDYADPSKVQTT